MFRRKTNAARASHPGRTVVADSARRLSLSTKEWSRISTCGAPSRWAS